MLATILARRMRRRAGVAILLATAMLNWGCETKTRPLSLIAPRAEKAMYPENSEGLRQYVDDLLRAYKSKKQYPVRTGMYSLVIPRNASWFMEVFGPTNGPILNLEYRHQLVWQLARINTHFRICAESGNCLVTISESKRGAFDESLLSAMGQPSTIYRIAISNRDEGPWIMIGPFVYMDESFRFLGSLEIHPDASFFEEYAKPFQN
jgi:hypothetical protein